MNTQRLDQLKVLFAREGYHALLCRMPQHVVMFAGYQPILGNTFCLISLTPAHELEMRLAVPVDGQDMVPQTGIKEVRTFTEETMTYISTTLDSVCKPLGEILRAAG